MYLAEAEGMHVASDSNGTLEIWWHGHGNKATESCKTSKDASHFGDIQGNANRGYSEGQPSRI